VIVSVAQCAWVLLSDAQSGLKKLMLTLGDLPAPANTRHLEIMREGHSVIHDSGPGEDGSAADAAPGQPARGHGDGEYDLSAEDREWIKQRDILGLLLRARRRLPGQAPVIAVTRVLPDSTARAEPSVDAAGSGRQPSRTCPPARHAHRAPGVMSGKQANDHTTRRGQSPVQLLDKETTNARLRVFVCNFCSTAEVVPWCEQLYCDHIACIEELEKLAAKHRLTSGRFHGPVNLTVMEKHLWDNHPHYAVTADAC
jgi:hypothetical protein